MLTAYIGAAMELAVYERLEDGSYAGRIPACQGVLAVDSSLRSSERQLQSILEDWVLLGIRLGHSLPVIAGIDLNQGHIHEPVDAL